MESFAVDLEGLLTVVAAVLDTNGGLLEANAGFLRLLPKEAAVVGTRLARFFIQPTFTGLMAAGEAGDGYRGLLTIGDYEGTTRTLVGRVWRSATGVRLLAEYDIVDLERLAEGMLALNQQSSVTRQVLALENGAMKQREGEIVEASLTDPLTGVGNRRRLDQTLATEISRVRRNEGTLAAIMLDVDHFKRVNDEYGHGAGDAVLARLGTLLSARIRPYDVVARFGGEEFMVLMPNASLAQALSRAEQFRATLETELIEPLPRPVTASFGVAELSPEESAGSFLERIDQALYRAKEGGRNQVVAALPSSR